MLAKSIRPETIIELASSLSFYFFLFPLESLYMKEILEVLRGTGSSIDLVLPSFISLMSYDKMCLISHEVLGYPCSDKGELCTTGDLSVKYEDIYITYTV